MPNSRDVPKYQWIRDEILSWIEAGSISPGDKLPIESDLATQFSASRQTIRQAVGELVTKGYLERIQGSGTYYVGQPVINATTTNSGIIAIVTTYISDYIFPHIIRGIEERLRADGYSPLLFTTQNDVAKERKALEDILSKSVDGVIAETTKSAYPNPNIDLFKQLQAQGTPVVMIHAAYPDLVTPIIEVDDRKGAYLAVKYLLDNGHTHIGTIMKMDDRQGLRRMEGFLQALTEAGITYNSDHVAFYTTEQQTTICKTYAQGLLRMDSTMRPTAVFCYNDQIATHLMMALRDSNLSIPDDISVIGFDDAPIAAQSYPGLTSIEHPKHAMGEAAAEAVLRLIHRETIPEPVNTFVPKLVERNSVRNLRVSSMI